MNSLFTWPNWVTNLITVIGLIGTLLGLFFAWLQAYKAKGYSDGVKDMQTEVEDTKNEIADLKKNTEQRIEEIQKEAKNQINQEKINAINKIKEIINYTKKISTLSAINSVLEDIHAKLIIINTSKPLDRNGKILKPIIEKLHKCNTKNIPTEVSKIIEDFIQNNSPIISKDELEQFVTKLEHVLKDIDKTLNGEI